MSIVKAALVCLLAVAMPAVEASHIPIDPHLSLVKARQATFDPTDSPYYAPASRPRVDQVATLKPVRGSGEKGRPLIPVPSGFRKNPTLRKNIVLRWENPEELTSAVLTADWANDDTIKVINFDDFEDAVESVDCKAPYVYLGFFDAEVYANVKQQWNWVNQKSNHQIIAFTDHPKCSGPDQAREPYRVQSITFNDDEHKVDMKVSKIDKLDDVLTDAELVIKSYVDPNEVISPSMWNETATDTDSFEVPVDDESGTAERRDITVLDKRGVSISLNQDLSGLKIFEMALQSENGTSGNVGLKCADCGTRGKLLIEGVVRWYLFVPTEASVQIKAQDVEARMKLMFYANVVANAADKMVLASPGLRVELYKVIRLEAVIDIGVGGDVTVAAEGDVTFGTVGRMEDSLWKICLLGCSDSRSGWSWEFEKIPPTARGEISIDVNVYSFVNPRVYVGAFGHGFEGGVAVLAPKLHGNLALKGDTEGGVCNRPDTTVGIEILLDYGLEIFAYVGQEFQDTIKEWPIYEFSKPFFHDCFTIATSTGKLPAYIVRAQAGCSDIRSADLTAFTSRWATMVALLFSVRTSCADSNYDAASQGCDDLMAFATSIGRSVEPVKPMCDLIKESQVLKNACQVMVDYAPLQSNPVLPDIKRACTSQEWQKAREHCWEAAAASTNNSLVRLVCLNFASAINKYL